MQGWQVQSALVFVWYYENLRNTCSILMRQICSSERWVSVGDNIEVSSLNFHCHHISEKVQILELDIAWDYVKLCSETIKYVETCFKSVIWINWSSSCFLGYLWLLCRAGQGHVLCLSPTQAIVRKHVLILASICIDCIRVRVPIRP